MVLAILKYHRGKTGRMDETSSTIHSAVAPTEVTLLGFVMPMLVA